MVRTLGFHPKNVGSNPASLNIPWNKANDFTTIGILVKLNKSQSPSLRNVKVQHTLKFATLYTPSTIKDISLFYRRNLEYNSRLVNKPNKKILIKQSYILMMWLGYIVNKGSKVDANKQRDINDESSVSGRDKNKIKTPSFFVYPFRNYKTTIVKAPMAHRSYSQEQFMIRFYTLSITFYTELSIQNNELRNFSVNKSFYFANVLKKSTPYTGTNMLFLQKYCVFFNSRDSNFFSFHRYLHSNSTNKLI
jgi:hypothetical protein